MEHKCHQRALLLHKNSAIYSLFKSIRVHCLAIHLLVKYTYKSSQDANRWAAQ